MYILKMSLNILALGCCINRLNLIYLPRMLLKNVKEKKIQFFLCLLLNVRPWRHSYIPSHAPSVFFLFFKRIKTKHILFSIYQDSIDWYIMPSKLDIHLWRSESISVCVIHLKSHYHKETFLQLLYYIKRTT